MARAGPAGPDRPLDDVIGRALGAARTAGASYAGVRIHRVRVPALPTAGFHLASVSGAG